VSLTQYCTATSLDGFIAGPDNSLDWLFTRQREPGGPLNYDEVIAGVAALAMGSTTYEWRYHASCLPPTVRRVPLSS
jgi:dihydrofolate reductase